MKPPPEGKHEITCPACRTSFAIFSGPGSPLLNYCPFCKAPLHAVSEHTDREGSRPHDTLSGHSSTATLVAGHTPEEAQIQFAIGPYQVLKSIGKGGMGEVLLAYDTQCGRRIALKRIRTDLASHPQLHNRFLKEARVTSQLTHPAIIPIYTIHSEKDQVYYTMPFVEGDTLKQILRMAQVNHRKGIRSEGSISSIPSLIRIFLTVCQAVAYAHSKGVLHRDLKPENIIVGRYGQVLILDWGLAKLTTQLDQDTVSDDLQKKLSRHPLHELTRIGKVVGTVSYMSPERARGQPATILGDIYSLGVILYQILTLRSPFRRGKLEEFRKNIHKEVIHDPVEVAPYRDVPKVLSRMSLKCLSPSPSGRYHTVDELIHDLENYIEGRSEWFQITKLDVNNKADWEFQENVLIAEHMAITRGTEVSAWVNLMISKISFPENTKIEAKVRIGDHGHGVGFLLSVPEAAERQHLNSGYCLWLASDQDKSTKLLRATVEVIFAPEIFLQRNETYHVKIEKVENNIHFYLNGILQFSYISHLPLIGTHIGLLVRDADFSIEDLNIFIGSHSIKVNCLAVPDAFLAHKDYAMALSEYRRIGYSFPGTAEGREGMFRAGITLLEEAKSNSDKRNSLYEQALDEFSKLHGTPGAPLEYLGKALVYQAMVDYQEEIKCFELAYRRYPHHPLLPVLQEQLVYRMHESSHVNRKATYHFVLLAVRHLPIASASNHTKKLFTSLSKHWEPLYFIEEVAESPDWSDKAYSLNFAVQLAFWLALPYALVEIIEETSAMAFPCYSVIGNAIFSLIELGDWKLVQHHSELLQQQHSSSEGLKKILQLCGIAILFHTDTSKALQELQIYLSNETTLDKQSGRVVFYFMERYLLNHQTAAVHQLADALVRMDMSFEFTLQIRCYRIWAYLLDNKWETAGELLHTYPLELLTRETSLLHFLYGCWLYVSEGKEIATIHFSSILEVAFPRSWTIFSHFLIAEPEKLEAWLQKTFLWERRQLYQQCALFYHCIGDEALASHYRDLEKEEYVYVDT